ncbi:MAG: molecular chaperone TorD family protein, partial [Acidiferrobacterales bacterium]|nr:molecular chaperone TorD family protein [Acidiferrobacterales bacterium]
MNEQIAQNIETKQKTNGGGIEAAPEERIRAHTYSLLATLLVNPPTSDVLELLKEIDTPSDVSDNTMTAAWQALRLAGEQATVEALQEEYHDLFIGIGRGELVPYGSWYTTGFLMDRPLSVLRQ